MLQMSGNGSGYQITSLGYFIYIHSLTEHFIANQLRIFLRLLLFLLLRLFLLFLCLFLQLHLSLPYCIIAITGGD